MTEPTRDPLPDDRADEDRGISDVGLPQPGDDDARTVDGEAAADRDTAALDEAFPPADGRA